MENEQDFIIVNPEEEKKLNETNVTTTIGQEDDQYEDECDFGFSNLENKKTVSLGKYDAERKHLTVSNGLNLKGKCSNPNCKANSQSKKTWVRLGMGHFNIAKVRFNKKCQQCDTKIAYDSFSSIGFTMAQLQIEGVRFDGDEPKDYTSKLEEREGKFIYFTDFDQDMTRWGYLNITVKEIKK